MPRDLDVSFVAIDEIQLAADLERGHVFTDRLLQRARPRRDAAAGRGHHAPAGRAAAARRRRSCSGRACPSSIYAGEKKLTRLPRRSAIVAFSAEEVYAIAELIRRQRGGAAVVLGALSPRTRNAQVALYQSGEVDYLVATDAIGMGLNLDVDHVAFAGGPQVRRLAVPPADARRSSARSPAAPAATARRHLRRHRPLRPLRPRDRRAARKS